MFKSSHPRGLYFLFFTELWERFGFYSLQTIIVLYLVKGLSFTDARADILYGTFSAMQYLTPALGGYIADRFIGFQKAIILGGILFVIGYLLTAVPNTDVFFVGLSVLIVANGLFKPNVSSIVGSLYPAGDARREGGFTIFYMGINVGSLIPPLFIGYVVLQWGWHVGFLFAALGMAIGMINFAWGRKRLGLAGAEPQSSPLKKPKMRFMFYVFFYLAIIVMIALFNLTFSFPQQTDLIVIIITVVTMLVVLRLVFKESRENRNRMIASLVLILIAVGFWAIYNQTFSSLMLFAERNMDPSFLGFKINAEFTQFFNPFWIVVLSPVLSYAWYSLGKRKLNPGVPLKFALGVFCLALGFYFLAYTSSIWNHDGKTDAWLLTISYLIQTVGELLLSPIGLAMITTLSPERYVGMMMGVWFLAVSSAFAISGGLASIAAIPENLSSTEALPIYIHAFYVYGNVALVLTLAALICVPFLRGLIKEQNKK